MTLITPETHKVVWGVYSQDCYGMTDEQSDRYLLRTYEDFGKALTFAEETSSRTAIHWKRVSLSHQCHDEQQQEVQASRSYGVVRVVLEECVSYWMIRGEMETGYALDCTDRPKRKQAEVIAREWCEKYGFAGFETITLTMKQEVNQ